MSKPQVFCIWLTLIPLFLLFWNSPYIDFPIRIAAWGIASLFLLGAVYLSWNFKVIRWIVLTAYFLIALYLILPPRSAARPEDLRRSYIEALRSYQGCRYVWGGENRSGVDCSGLVQRALEEALFKTALRTFNPGLIRSSVSLYWNRTTAREIGAGFSGRTYLVTKCRSLNSLDYSLLLPGDMAVTMSGIHILAYLGDHTWIDADPFPGRVMTFRVPQDHNDYCSSPMKIVRWKVLEK